MMQTKLVVGKERSMNLRMVTYFPVWYSLSSYADVWASAFVVIIGVCKVSQFVLFGWEFYSCVSFLYRFLGCWLSVAPFTGLFVISKRDWWSKLKRDNLLNPQGDIVRREVKLPAF